MKTLWVRPACFGSWLVSKADGNLKDIVDGYFNSNDHETFIKVVTETMENEKFLNLEKAKSKNPYTVELDCDFGDIETIEYKLVEMTDEQVDNMDEFPGW